MVGIRSLASIPHRAGNFALPSDMDYGIDTACLGLVGESTIAAELRFTFHLPLTFLQPFAPRALPRFHATMVALTPRRLSNPRRGLPA